MTAFPGIEVSLDCGHILVIADPYSLDTFEDQANQIAAKITQANDSISINEFTAVFRNVEELLHSPL